MCLYIYNIIMKKILVFTYWAISWIVLIITLVWWKDLINLEQTAVNWDYITADWVNAVKNRFATIEELIWDWTDWVGIDWSDWSDWSVLNIPEPTVMQKQVIESWWGDDNTDRDTWNQRVSTAAGHFTHLTAAWWTAACTIPPGERDPYNWVWERQSYLERCWSWICEYVANQYSAGYVNVQITHCWEWSDYCNKWNFTLVCMF